MTAPHYADGPVTLWHGDCIDVMRTLPDASVDAVVTDPPYGLEFMGREWDGADGFRRSLNAADVGRENTFGRMSAKAPEYRAGTLFQDWCELWATEALRLLKPGGHLLAFGGTRTHHRLASGIEDAGFEIRDSIFWAYGSGFPKSLNVTDALGRIVPDDARCACGPRSTRTAQDSPAGYPSSHGSGDAQPRPGSGADRSSAPSPADAPARTRAGQRADAPGAARANSGPDAATGHLAIEGSTDPWERLSAVDPLDASVPSGTRTSMSDGSEPVIRRTVDRTPSSFDLASVAPSLKCDRCGCVKIPEGAGTALKPAAEPVVVARKPLSGTVAANVLAYGTGALNIDASRIGTAEDKRHPGTKAYTRFDTGSPSKGTQIVPPYTSGRWPANVVLDAPQAAALDQQSGVTRDGVAGANRGFQRGGYVGGTTPDAGLPDLGYGGEGGASRFFYTAKASTDERPSVDGIAHPTVKPVDLMRWLVRLVTPKGGTILEPFAGSGTTVEAAVLEGFRCIAIEREADYLPLIMQRVSKPHAVGLDFGDWEDVS